MQPLDHEETACETSGPSEIRHPTAVYCTAAAVYDHCPVWVGSLTAVNIAASTAVPLLLSILPDPFAVI